MNDLLPPRREASIALCSDACGAACCRTAGMGIYLDTAERDRLRRLGGPRIKMVYAPRREGSTAPYVLKFTDHGGRCPFLHERSNRCGIYADRPGACKNFPTVPTAGCLVWPAPDAIIPLAITSGRMSATETYTPKGESNHD